MRQQLAVFRFLGATILTLAGLSGVVSAADNLVGHSSSGTKYRGTPPAGSGYKIAIKAGKNGNGDTFPLPLDPVTNGGSVSVSRGGGVLHDPLTAGTWTGVGNPPGSKGWKYRNKDAPSGGAVSALVVSEKTIKVTAKGTGSMPVPIAPNAAIDTVIVADGVRYCAQAVAPYEKEVDGKQVKSKNQPAPLACPPCAVGIDSDGDRLDDCYETNTGIYVSVTDAGTDPLVADSDGDAISDGDEVLGSSGGLDLQGLGASPLRRDILLEYDWFDDNLDSETCAAHSHRPTAGALAQVTAAYAAAPLSNPDGTTGIHAIHDYGQGGAFSGGNFIADANGVITLGVNDGEYKAHKIANFAANRDGYFHYVLMPHRYFTDSTSSGQAELPGNDLIVSLYCYGSDGNVANTIVHELGHNMNLRHGGLDNCNYKPNYNSVMNYLYQFPGVDTNCTPPGNGVIDYSSGDRIDLDETNLDENLGTCGAPPWDWNGNMSLESGVSFDINFDDEGQVLFCGGVLTTLRDYDDWAHISFGGLSDADGAPVLAPEIIECTNPPPPIVP